MNWILIIWIYTGSFGYPAYFGRYDSKKECENMFRTIELRLPGNGNTVNNHICVDNKKESYYE